MKARLLRRKRSWERRCLAVALLWATTLALGCGPDYGEAFLKSYRGAQRAFSAGRYQQAAQLYERAAQDAQRIKDRDEAYFMQALMFERLERWEQARATYRHLIEVSPQGPRTARAVFEHATLQIDHGDAKAGWRELKVAIEHYPNHGATSYSVKLWVAQVASTRGEDELRAELDHWLVTLKGTEVEQQLKYERAMSLRRSGDLPKAHAWLRRAAREHPYPKGNLTDDALWHASHVAEQMGDFKAALADLRELLAAREEAHGGSYERPRFPQAQMRIAELYRDNIVDLAAARREFRRTYQRHQTSILADDAMWQEAVLAKRQGDVAGACALAEELPSRFPDSRYRKCLRELCPKAKQGARSCPRYIKAQLDPSAVRAQPQ